MKHWPTWRCAECLNIHCSLGEIASDIGARPILGELLYILAVQIDFSVVATFRAVTPSICS